MILFNFSKKLECPCQKQLIFQNFIIFHNFIILFLSGYCILCGNSSVVTQLWNGWCDFNDVTQIKVKYMQCDSYWIEKALSSWKSWKKSGMVSQIRSELGSSAKKSMPMTIRVALKWSCDISIRNVATMITTIMTSKEMPMMKTLIWTLTVGLCQDMIPCNRSVDRGLPWGVVRSKIGHWYYLGRLISLRLVWMYVCKY